MITVININDKKHQDKLNLPNYIFCGRPSKYGNPFVKRNESERGLVIDKFAKETLKNLDVTELVQLSLEGDLYLGCYCKPRVCHCDLIKEKIEWLLGEF